MACGPIDGELMQLEQTRVAAPRSMGKLDREMYGYDTIKRYVGLEKVAGM